MIELQRKYRKDVKETMFIRPKDPDDHAEFEWLLPQCLPMFVYRDGGGRDWVRWALPREVAEGLGWGVMKCACCDTTGETDGDYFHIDTAYDEVSFFLEGDDDR